MRISRWTCRIVGCFGKQVDQSDEIPYNWDYVFEIFEWRWEQIRQQRSAGKLTKRSNYYYYYRFDKDKLTLLSVGYLQGIVIVFTLSKVLLMYVIEVQLILNGSAGPVCSLSPLSYFEPYNLIAFCTANKVYIHIRISISTSTSILSSVNIS